MYAILAAELGGPLREEDLPTQAAAPQAGSRLLTTHVQSQRQEGVEETPTETSRPANGRPRQVIPLRGAANFRRTMEHGGRYSDQVLALRALRREDDDSAGVVRIGVALGRRFGKAVQRNRIRRWLRECARAVLDRPRGAWDLVFIPLAAARTITHDQLRESVSRLARRAGVCEATH